MTRAELDRIAAKPHGSDVQSLIDEIERCWTEANELRRKMMHYRATAEAAGNEASLAVANRCATIADKYADDPHGSNPSCSTGEAIAKEIRDEFNLCPPRPPSPAA